MAWEDSAALSKHTENILTFPSHEWARIRRGSYFIRFLSLVTETTRVPPQWIVLIDRLGH
jgi:hypothetical protein